MTTALDGVSWLGM
uniref:Uncharacterized protein n=1 Tax=Leuconostoc citreum TaxID=33964 RepID=A0A098DLK4_LEUCI|nr:Protein of unknown function [Leuconostoc citreum]